jgi:hypothetical protein
MSTVKDYTDFYFEYEEKEKSIDARIDYLETESMEADGRLDDSEKDIVDLRLKLDEVLETVKKLKTANAKLQLWKTKTIARDRLTKPRLKSSITKHRKNKTQRSLIHLSNGANTTIDVAVNCKSDSRFCKHASRDKATGACIKCSSQSSVDFCTSHRPFGLRIFDQGVADSFGSQECQDCHEMVDGLRYSSWIIEVTIDSLLAEITLRNSNFDVQDTNTLRKISVLILDHFESNASAYCVKPWLDLKSVYTAYDVIEKLL